MDDKLTIRVNIVDRYYPLKIDRKDEEKIRKATKKINDTDELISADLLNASQTAAAVKGSGIVYLGKTGLR